MSEYSEGGRRAVPAGKDFFSDAQVDAQRKTFQRFQLKSSRCLGRFVVTRFFDGLYSD